MTVHFLRLASFACLTLLLAGCGGGNVETGGDITPEQGIFVDSPVQGLTYSASPSGLAGLTDAQGRFDYRPGDKLTFRIGDLELGTVPAAAIITPLSFFPDATGTADVRVVNLARLLQSLDENLDPTDGITIATEVGQATTGTALALEPGSDTFDTEAGALVSTLRTSAYGDTNGLVDAASALAHLTESLAAMNDGDSSDDRTGGNGSDDNDTDRAPPPFTTSPDLSAASDIYAAVIEDFETYYSTDVTITASDIVENGSIASVTIDFPREAGTLWVFFSSNPAPLVAKADFLVAGNNGRLSLRAKLADSGILIVVFVTPDGRMRTGMKNVQVNIGAYPKSGSCNSDCYPPLSINDVRLRDTSETTKFFITSEMNQEDYISAVLLSFDDVLYAAIYPTPYVSKSPYFGVAHAHRPGTTVELTVKATGQRNVTVTTVSK